MRGRLGEKQMKKWAFKGIVVLRSGRALYGAFISSTRFRTKARTTHM